MNKAEVVHDIFASYIRQDRHTAERLIAESFLFTSPQDDHIDRAAYFERCFPYQHSDAALRPAARHPNPW